MKILVVGISRKFLAFFFILSILFSPTIILAQSESGSVGLEGRVGAIAPTEAPVILVPDTDERFEESPITVSGTCQSNLLIKIYVNDTFSGSVICEGNAFTIEVDLFTGENEIIARAYDNLDQASPDSNIVTVHLNAITQDATEPEVTTPVVAQGDLRLSSEHARKGANPNETLTWPISIMGGSPPYAVHVDWGDGRTSLKSVLSVGDYNIEHNYLYSGIYKVVVRAVDTKNNRAILQLVAVSKGVSTAPNAESISDKPKEVVLLQPMVIFITFMISTFWLGKRYERKRMQE